MPMPVPDEREHHFRMLDEIIAEHGVIIQVSKQHRKCYTIGLERSCRHPDIAILGLEHEFAARVLHNVVERHVRGGDGITDQSFVTGVLPDGLCLLAHQLPGGTARTLFSVGSSWYDRHDITGARMLQLFWPFRDGSLPGTDSCPDDVCVAQLNPTSLP